MNEQELKAENERLRRENAELQRRASRDLSMKVSEKGALSVYGLNRRFPVTLYKEQWQKLLSHEGAIREFMAAHDHELKGRG